ncbi:MAG: cysteine hydrolase [Proteobacteria bacterium]|nr:cysteine hydrolase [Pseudomonadota bacterium]
MPPTHSTALIIIDMINALDFDGGAALLKNALPAAHRIARLKYRARQAGAPVIYANDNYGQWRSDFRQVVAVCGESGSRGAPLVQALQPEPDDYFVLKPKQSAFHATALELLLHDLGVHRLVLTGTAADNCVLATATDAHIRDFEILVPGDCLASVTRARTTRALAQIRDTLQADTRPSTRITRALLQG